MTKPTQEQVIQWAHEAGLHIATDVHWMPIIGLKYIEKATALAYEAGRKDAFQDGAKAMFDALLFRVANNWHPRAQEQCDVENEWATAWAADALDEVSPEDCAEWKSIKKSWKDGYEAGRKDENEECGKICDAAQLFGNSDERWAAKCCSEQIRARREQ